MENQSPCDGCHAGCCRSFAVPVTGADILRIEEHTGKTVWEFVCRWADHDGRIARNYAPHFLFSDEPGTPFVMCLIHGESRNFPQTSKCQFLKETPPTEEKPLGTAQCGIYHARPAACRAFPTRLNDTNEVALVHSIPEQSREKENPLYALCPREWTPADFHPLNTIHDLVLAKYEMAFFHKLAKAWNQQPGPLEALPEFLKAVYKGRVQLDPERRAEVEIDAEAAA